MESKKETSTQTMVATEAKNIRALVKYVNEYKIKKEDIVSLVKNGEQYILIYYI